MTPQDMTVEAARLAKTRALTLFETRADLYYRRTGYLAPGKDCRIHDTGSDENRERFGHWCTSGLMQIDALLKVDRLRESLEAMESRAEDAEYALAKMQKIVDGKES